MFLFAVGLCSAGTVFWRQNMTSVDVRFWRQKTKDDPRTERITVFLNDRRPITRVVEWGGYKFKVILGWQNPLVSMVYTNILHRIYNGIFL